MKAKAKRRISRVFAVVIAAVLVISFGIPFCAEENNDLIYNFDYTNLITKTYGDRGYIDPDEGNLSVNLDGVKSDIRLFGVEYNISTEGIPTGTKLESLISDLTSHGYNFLVLKDVYSLLKNSANYTAFDEFLAGLYEANMYVEIELFSVKSLCGGSTSAPLLNAGTVTRARSFIKSFFSRKNAVRSDNSVKVTYAQDTTIAFVKYCSGIDIGSESKYYDQTQKEFNEWLEEEYNLTDVLSGAWLDSAGNTVLTEGEDIKKATVKTPTAPAVTLLNDSCTGHMRESDFARFLLEYAPEKLAEIEEYIRSFGYRSPIICSDKFDSAFNTYISGCGQAACGAFVFKEGADINDAIASAALGVIASKPYIVTWNINNVCNDSVSALAQVVSYASYQGWDALVIGSYSFAAGAGSVNGNALMWNNSGLFATFFRHKSVIASYGNNYGISYSAWDTVMNFGDYRASFRDSVLIAKTENIFFKDEFESNPDFKLIKTSGVTSSGSYIGANSNKDSGTKVIVESLRPYQDATFYSENMIKQSWYNAQGVVSTRDRVVENISGSDVYFGEGKAIIPDGNISGTYDLATIFDRMGFVDYENADDETDLYQYSSSGLMVSDNGRLFYNEMTESLVAFGSRFFMASGSFTDADLNSVYDSYIDRYYYESSLEPEYQNLKVSVSELGTDGTVAVYALGEGVTNENADEFVIFASASDGVSPLTGKVTLLRENTKYAVYGVNDDGTKGALITPEGAVSTDKGVMTVELSGDYKYYVVQLEETDIDSSLEGYDPNLSIPEHQNLFWYIVIPAIFFLIVVYSGILISDNLKLKREEKLRLATREVTLSKTGKYASALDVNDDGSLRPDANNAARKTADIFAETEEERRRRENPWEREDGVVDYFKIVRSEDDDENAW